MALYSGTSAARREGSSPFLGNGYSLTAKGFVEHRKVLSFFDLGLSGPLTPVLTPFGSCHLVERNVARFQDWVTSSFTGLSSREVPGSQN